MVRASPGGRSGRVEPTEPPTTSAPPSIAAASTALRCWGRRPGLSRLARILTIRNGRPVRSDSVRAVRRIWPPPSPLEPSSVTSFDPGSVATEIPPAPRLDSARRPADLAVRARRVVAGVGDPPLGRRARARSWFGPTIPVASPLARSFLSLSGRTRRFRLESRGLRRPSRGIGLARTARSGSLVGLAFGLRGHFAHVGSGWPGSAGRSGTSGRRWARAG